MFKRDFAAARRLLESVAESSLPPMVLPPVAAYPGPFDEGATVAHREGSAPLTATTAVYSSRNLRAVEFVEASLEGLDIPFRRICLESGAYEIQVRPANENAARVIDEIASGTSTQATEAEHEDKLLQDEPPKATFCSGSLR